METATTEIETETETEIETEIEIRTEAVAIAIIIETIVTQTQTQPSMVDDVRDLENLKSQLKGTIKNVSKRMMARKLHKLRTRKIF